MDQNELLDYLTAAFDRHEISYAITGSHASNVYGDTRFTNDIDVVVQLNSLARLDELLTEFPSGSFYISLDGARHAVTHGGQFKIIHEDTSQKIDVIIPEHADWPDAIEHRQQFLTAPGKKMWFISLEDLILKKMDFYREGGSDKHLRDIASALRVSRGKVGLEYISQWSIKLGLEDIWQTVQQRVVK